MEEEICLNQKKEQSTSFLGIIAGNEFIVARLKPMNWLSNSNWHVYAVHANRRQFYSPIEGEDLRTRGGEWISYLKRELSFLSKSVFKECFFCLKGQCLIPFSAPSSSCVGVYRCVGPRSEMMCLDLFRHEMGNDYLRNAWKVRALNMQTCEVERKWMRIKCNFSCFPFWTKLVNRGLAGFSLLSSVFLSPQHCYWEDPFIWLQFYFNFLIIVELLLTVVMVNSLITLVTKSNKSAITDSEIQYILRCLSYAEVHHSFRRKKSKINNMMFSADMFKELLLTNYKWFFTGHVRRTRKLHYVSLCWEEV